MTAYRSDFCSLSLAQMLAERARELPHAVAIETHDPSGSGSATSYSALAARSATLAGALRELAVPDGVLLALAAPAAGIVDGLLAAQWAGHALLPLDPALVETRLPLLQAQSPQPIHRLADLPSPIDEDSPAPQPASPNPEAAALVIATSGSEGTPKGVELSHRALCAAAAASRSGIPLAPGNRWLNCLPLTHIGGLSILWRCFQAGAGVLLHERFSAPAVWADLQAGRASHISLVPAMLARILDAAGDSPAPKTLRCVLVGGAALSQALHDRARAAGWPLHVSYGMTETAAQVAMLPPSEAWSEGRVGRALPGSELAIGHDGRILVRGAQRMLGYLGNAAAAPDEWLATGDLGSLSADGMLTVIGRADDVLVSAGQNLHPAEIEMLLIDCPGVLDAAVTACRDPVWGDVVTALLVGSAAADSVADWCRQHLPSPLRPRRFIRVEALPRNEMGKLERRRLPALLAGARS